MSEKIPGKEESFEELVEKVRTLLINELSNSIEIYGPSWINKENCERLVDDLRNKRPTKIWGPLYGDHLDGVLYDLGIKSLTDGKYEAIQKELEKGKE